MRPSVVLAGILLLGIPTAGQPLIRPGILHSFPELHFLKEGVAKGQAPWKSASDALKRSRFASLSHKPRPFADVICGSYNVPNTGCNEMVEDGAIAYTQALLWWFTGDKRHAALAQAILKAWTSTYRKNSDSNARLVVSWAAPWYANAGEILLHTHSGWPDADAAALASLLTGKWLPYVLDETMPPNNWILSALEAHMAIAVFTGDRDQLERAAERWRLRVKTYIYQAADGPKPIPPPGKTEDQTRRIWKSESPGTDYIDGLAMETCRDLGHLGLGIRSLMYAAETAWHQGIDLFGPEQERLSDFLELHARWTMGLEKVPGNICGGRLMLNKDTRMGENGGGNQAYEIAYNHLAGRLGRNLPATAAMLKRARPAEAGLWVEKWETLTHGDLPPLGVISGLRENRVRARAYPSLRGLDGPAAIGTRLAFPWKGVAFSVDGTLLQTPAAPVP